MINVIVFDLMKRIGPELNQKFIPFKLKKKCDVVRMLKNQKSKKCEINSKTLNRQQIIVKDNHIVPESGSGPSRPTHKCQSKVS